MNMDNTKKTQNVTIDPASIPSMKCYCGSNIFFPVVNLKYVSPFLCGDPKGQSIYVQFWKCLLCGQLYNQAKPQGEVQKIYNSLAPEQKQNVKSMRANLKLATAEAEEKLKAAKKKGGKGAA